MRVVLRVSTDTLKTDTRKMPKLATPLTDIQPRTAKPKAKPYKLTDGGGLFLLVNPDGAKYWRMGYRFTGTERLLAFGKYPQVTLSDARGNGAAMKYPFYVSKIGVGMVTHHGPGT
jgi:hypothetical protein